MQRQCPICSTVYDTDQVAFSECPECIRNRFQATGAILPRHTLSGVQAQASGRPKSYAALDGDKIFDYMAYGPQPGPSGCVLVRSLVHNSVNAISHMPLGAIPGSGVHPGGGHFAAHFAVLADVEGKSKDGPHFMFEEESRVPLRFNSREWERCPDCKRCSQRQTYDSSGYCTSCQIVLGLL
jgi:hypothetical protein